jgi:DNA repair photolyase
MPRPVQNPPNPWSSTQVEWIGEPPPAKLEVFEEEGRSILSENSSPDVGFRWSVNPYRGCLHACAYCYARPTHQYLGFGAGSDFDRKIVAKVNAPDLLRKAFLRPSWQGEWITFSGVTDCYQPLEASYQLTRRCLEVCLEFRNPVAIITKGSLVRRDLDLLASLSREADAQVYVSIPFADDATGRKIEPYASAVSQRFETLRLLTEAGISAGVAVAPVIPGLNDSAIPEVLERAHRAGARRAFMSLLRLPAEVQPVFDERIHEAFPDRARKIQNGILEVRQGKMNDSTFGRRMAGEGVRWQAVRSLFDVQCRRLGLNADDRDAPKPSTFRRPVRQGSLF